MLSFSLLQLKIKMQFTTCWIELSTKVSLTKIRMHSRGQWSWSFPFAEVHVACPQVLLLHCPAPDLPASSEVNHFPWRASRNVKLEKSHQCNYYIPLSLLCSHVFGCSALANPGTWDEGFVMFFPSPSPASKVRSNGYSCSVSLQEHPTGTQWSCP